MIKFLLRLLSIVICLGLWAGGIYMSYTETDWDAIKADWGDVSAAMPDLSGLGGGGSEEEQLPEQNPDDSGTQEPEQDPES